MTEALLLIAGAVVGFSLAGLTADKARSRTEARFRRSGWRYGYGAGWVDCRNGVYAPESVPPDGMVRSTKPGVEQ